MTLPRAILYFGSNSPDSTSSHRVDALRRLGCDVSVVDPVKLIGKRHHWLSFIDYRTGYFFLQNQLLRALKISADLQSSQPNVIWIDSGELYGSRVLNAIASRFRCPIILYNVDDPTGPRDGLRFVGLKTALAHYTLSVFVRQETALEALSVSAQRVLTVHRSFDEIFHVPPLDSADEPPQRVVSFIGTMIKGESRDRWLVSLMLVGLPLRLIGNLWHRSPLWPELKKVYAGPGRSGQAYAKALSSATVSLGLLSHQNRDLVTQRSFEVPACGGLLCAERTSEHQLLYEDGHEAMFWDSIEECISHCNLLLDDTNLRDQICRNGHHHVYEMGVGNEDICRQILAFI